MPHQLTEIIARRAKELAANPDAVAVVEQRREDRFLLVHIYPGTYENIGAIIGVGAENIEGLRRYVESLAAGLEITVKVRVITPDRQPARARE